MILAQQVPSLEIDLTNNNNNKLSLGLFTKRIMFGIFLHECTPEKYIFSWVSVQLCSNE